MVVFLDTGKTLYKHGRKPYLMSYQLMAQDMLSHLTRKGRLLLACQLHLLLVLLQFAWPCFIS